jgi:hypothetical protein
MCRPLIALSLLLLVQASAAPVRVWTFTNDLAGWTPGNWESTAIDANGFSGVSKYDCGLLSPKLGIEAEDYPELLVSMTTDIGGGGETFFKSVGKGLTDERKARHVAIASTKPRLYRILLQDQPGWEGTIDQIRFDPLNPAGANIKIDFIALMPKAGMSPVNGSMEIMRDGKPFGWRAIGTGATVTHDTPRSGRNALRTQAGSGWELGPIDLSLLGTYRIDGFARRAKGSKATFMPFVLFEADELLPSRGRQWGAFHDHIPATDDWAPFTYTFTCPRYAYHATVKFGFFKGGTVDLDDVYITHVKPGDIVDPGPPRPQWQATWIWHPDALELDNQTAFFRYDLTLPDRAIKRALLQITADDHYALNINGERVETQFGVPDGWRVPEVVDLSKALKPGVNQFEVEARDAASAQGLIAEGIITFADGSEMPIRTSRDWQTARTLDGPWVPSYEHGTPPCAPWRDLPTADLAEPVPVQGILKPLPASVSSPNRVPVTLKLTPKRDCRRPVFVQARLHDGNQLLAEAWAQKPVFNVERVANATATLNWQLTVPYGVATDNARVSFLIRGGAFAGTAPSGSLKLQAPVAKTGFPKAECRVIDGLPRLLVNDQEIDPTQALFIRPDQLHQRNARKGRIPILCLGIEDIGFTEKGFDYTNVDTILATYLGSYPDAWVITNFTFGTRYQRFWINAHPEARCRMEDGSDVIGDYHGNRRTVPSFSSDVWRETYGDALRRLIRHLKDGPFASRIIGHQPCSGITTEWFHWGAQSGDLVDYSDAGKKDFRRWLKRKYGTDAALRKAWHQPAVTLAAAAIPSGERRRGPKLGIYFDPQSQRDVIDYNRYQHDVVADAIGYFARIIKEESDGRSLVGTYYGYVTHLPEIAGFCQGSGHFSMRKMLDNPDIDFMMAPLAYSWREPGKPGASMTATASHALNGKLWWHQEDLRTQWVRPPRYGASGTLRETIDVFRRELARNLTQGTAIQWYDFSKGWTFGDDRLAEEVGRLRTLNEYRTKGKEWPLSTYLAVIVDEEQMGTFDPFRPPYSLNLIYRQRDYLNRAGIPWKCYLLSDLRKHPKLLEHRAFLFLNLFSLDGDQRQFLREKVMTNGRTVAFVGPAGMITPQGIDPKASSQLLGLDMVRLPDDTKLHSTFGKDLGAPWTGLSDTHFNISTSQPPLLAPRQSKGTLALLDGRTEPAVVAETRATHQLFWTAIPGLLPQHLRALARYAKLPVLATSDDPVYFGHGFLALHAASDGERTIHLPEPAAVRDLLTSQTWPAGTKSVTLPFRYGQTLLLHCTR